jgi:hypothetical protein
VVPEKSSTLMCNCSSRASILPMNKFSSTRI